MKSVFYVAAAVFLVALHVYFIGTPLVANLTGFSERAVSLTAATTISILGFSVMMLGKLAAKRNQNRE